MTNTSHSTAPLLLGAAALLLLAACGGGGAPGGATVGTASLTGEILEVDGYATALAGIEVALLETGKAVVTAADGSFDLGEVPTGTLSLVVATDPVSLVLAQAAAKGGPADSGGNGGNGESGGTGDPHQGGWTDEQIDDGEDTEGNAMYVHRVRSRERIHVRLRLRDGEICEGECIREQNQERNVEMHMQGAPTSDDPDVSAKLEVEVRLDRERLRVQVRDCDEGRMLELQVQNREQAWESQGTRTCDGSGEARWETDTAQGGRLPFRAGSLGDLEGNRWQVCDAQSGTCLCEGRMPDVPPCYDDASWPGAQQGSAKATADAVRDRLREQVGDGSCSEDGQGTPALERDRDRVSQE